MANFAYKYRLYPTAAQALRLGEVAGHCRFLYNRLVEEQAKRWRHLQEIRRDGDQSRVPMLRRGSLKHPDGYGYGFFTKLVAEHDWLDTLPGAIANAVVGHFVVAFTRFLEFRKQEEERRRLGLPPRRRRRKRRDGMPPVFPAKKRRGDRASLTIPYGLVLRIEPGARFGTVHVPTLGPIRFRHHRLLRGQAKSATIERCGGQWHVSICVEMDALPPRPPAPHHVIGVDRNIATNMAMTSDGEAFAPFEGGTLEVRKRRAQRALRRKRKPGRGPDGKFVAGSRNWMKQQAKVARLSARLARKRNDTLHKVAHTLVSRHDVVVFEDLDVKGMTASARGTAKAPGRRVRQKSGLNRAILAQGWSRLKTLAEEKAPRYGTSVAVVPAAYTSQTCPVCGHVDSASRRGRVFSCTACGHTEDADVVGAKNVKNRWAGGQPVTACGGRAEVTVGSDPSLGVPTKQEGEAATPCQRETDSNASTSAASRTAKALAASPARKPEWLRDRIKNWPKARRLHRWAARTPLRKSAELLSVGHDQTHEPNL